MYKIHITIILLMFFALGQISGQSPAKKAKRADELYQAGKYALAIPLYKEALAEQDNRAWQYKLANSYRLTNQTAAAQLYYDLLFGDPKRMRPKMYREYSEVLMSNGDYEQAKERLMEYTAMEPKDESAAYLLAQMDKIREIPAMYPDAEIRPFAHNSDADDHGAVYWNGGWVFVSDRKQEGFNIFKEKAGATGRDFLSLYFAPIDSAGTLGTPVILPRKINMLNKHTGPASFTEDGQTVAYSQNDHSDADKLSLQLFTAKWEGGKWKDVRKVGFCKPGLNYMHPAITPDGKSLYFIMDKTHNAEGGTDLYVAHLRADGEWGRPENLGPIVNTPENEGFPFVDQDGKLYFCSKGHLGYGGFDIFMTWQDSMGTWQTPTNLGMPINSTQDDISFCLASNGQEGCFSSSRDGGDDDIFHFRSRENDLCIPLKVTAVMPFGQDTPHNMTIIRATPQDSLSSHQPFYLETWAQEAKLYLRNDTSASYQISISQEGFKSFSQTINPAQWKKGETLEVMLAPQDNP